MIPCGRCLAGLVVLGFATSAAVRGADDYGNHPASAAAFAGTSNRIAGVFETYADQDYFSFPVLPGWTYAVQVSTVTVWDVRVEVVPPLGTPRMDGTNTVHADAPASMVWTNPGTAGRWYLRLTPMFQFSTGAYEVAVWAQPTDQDADGDGMADLWELDRFGSVTQANVATSFLLPGYTDREVYLAGLEVSGGIELVSWEGDPAPGVLGWQPAPHAAYEIVGAGAVDGSWSVLGTSIAGAADPILRWTNRAVAATSRFIRVRFAP